MNEWDGLSVRVNSEYTADVQKLILKEMRKQTILLNSLVAPENRLKPEDLIDPNINDQPKRKSNSSTNKIHIVLFILLVLLILNVATLFMRN
jgi:hypothetical protein